MGRAPNGHNERQARKAAEVRARIVDIWLETNKTHEEIGLIVGLSRPTVSQHLARAHEDWKANALASYEAKVRRELAKLDKVEATLWEAWRRSCKDAVVTTSEVVQGRGKTQGSKAGTSKISERREGQAGDARFLAEIRACVELRAKVLGLITKQVQHSGSMEVVKTYHLPASGRQEDAVVEDGAKAFDDLLR